DRKEAVEGVGAERPCQRQLAPDAVDVPLGRQPATDPGEPVDDGKNGTLAEGIQELAVALVLDLVPAELAERLANGGLLLSGAHEGVHGQADGEEDCDE